MVKSYTIGLKLAKEFGIELMGNIEGWLGEEIAKKTEKVSLYVDDFEEWGEMRVDGLYPTDHGGERLYEQLDIQGDFRRQSEILHISYLAPSQEYLKRTFGNIPKSLKSLRPLKKAYEDFLKEPKEEARIKVKQKNEKGTLEEILRFSISKFIENSSLNSQKPL